MTIRPRLRRCASTAVNPGTTYTSLPQVGQIVKADQPVYGVSDVPVPLLYGSIPAYRAFYVGMADGSDVGQLTRNLIALGFGAGLAQSDHFSAATAAAVERWQRATGPSQRPARFSSGRWSSSQGRSGSLPSAPSVGASAGPRRRGGTVLRRRTRRRW